jgi:hypothetical protein
MTAEKLKTSYYIFGNKGNVWNDKCHIAKAGDFTGRTLCGVPMLSSNWAKIEQVSHIGCEECNKIYNEPKS